MDSPYHIAKDLAEHGQTELAWKLIDKLLIENPLDVQALQAPGAIEAVRESNCAICLMHMKGEPATMQREPHYDDVVGEVKAFLRGRVAAAEAAGIARERLVIDPGFGFGKTAAHNLTLLKRLDQFADLQVPLLAGLSRKSTIGKLTGRARDVLVGCDFAAILRGKSPSASQGNPARRSVSLRVPRRAAGVRSTCAFSCQLVLRVRFLIWTSTVVPLTLTDVVIWSPGFTFSGTSTEAAGMISYQA